MEQLRTRLQSHTPLYENAEAQLDTSGKPLWTSAEALVEPIRSARFVDAKPDMAVAFGRAAFEA